MNKFSDFVYRTYADILTLKRNRKIGEKILANPSCRFVLKKSTGERGEDVRIYNCADYTYELLINKMQLCGFNLVEEYVVQHSSLMALSSSGVNTIRVITQIVNNEVIFWAARLRISVNSDVDNLAAGNIAAPINLNNGIVDGPAVYSDITKGDVIEHPVSKIPIKGFKIPFWRETLDLIKRAALQTLENRSIGWDVAISDKGPELIEGNHNWCKLLWQLPAKKGLKNELMQFTEAGQLTET